MKIQENLQYLGIWHLPHNKSQRACWIKHVFSVTNRGKRNIQWQWSSKNQNTIGRIKCNSTRNIWWNRILGKPGLIRITNIRSWHLIIRKSNLQWAHVPELTLNTQYRKIRIVPMFVETRICWTIIQLIDPWNIRSILKIKVHN